MSRSREITFRYLTEHKIANALVPEIVNATHRLETLADEMLAGEKPETNKQRLEEILDGLMNIRCCAEKLK